MLFYPTTSSDTPDRIINHVNSVVWNHYLNIANDINTYISLIYKNIESINVKCKYISKYMSYGKNALNLEASLDT